MNILTKRRVGLMLLSPILVGVVAAQAQTPYPQAAPYGQAYPGYGYTGPSYSNDAAGYSSPYAGYPSQSPAARYYGYGQRTGAGYYPPYSQAGTPGRYGYGRPSGGYSPYAYQQSGSGPNVPSGPWNQMPFLNRDDPMLSGDNPFQNPFNHHGYWAQKGFEPWQSGPFEADRWNKIQPMNNMPWGKFPGWGDGAFGGFGPADWKGATPWGNNVPFKWFHPSNPRTAFGDMWDDAINTPNKMGRMPPGWTAPYISVPNPVEVESVFEENARKFPHEMRKMFNTGNGDFSNSASGDKHKKDAGKDGKGKTAQAKGKDNKPVQSRPFIEPMKPMGPLFQDEGKAKPAANKQPQ